MDKVKIVRGRIKDAQDRQKSYVDQHSREMTYEVGENVFLRVSPWKGVIRSMMFSMLVCFDDTDQILHMCFGMNQLRSKRIKVILRNRCKYLITKSNSCEINPFH